MRRRSKSTPSETNLALKLLRQVDPEKVTNRLSEIIKICMYINISLKKHILKWLETKLDSTYRRIFNNTLKNLETQLHFEFSVTRGWCLVCGDNTTNIGNTDVIEQDHTNNSILKILF